MYIYIKVKLPLRGQAYIDGGGVALPTLDSVYRMALLVSCTPRLLCPRERGPIRIVQGGGWASGPVWMGQENFVLTGVRTPDPPGRGESLYWLRAPSPSDI